MMRLSAAALAIAASTQASPSLSSPTSSVPSSTSSNFAPAVAAHRGIHATVIAAQAVCSLLLEVDTWPKPGLVSHVDTGSHTDMDVETFRVSATVLEPYFHALAEAGARDFSMARLRAIGIDAEAAMLQATAGINTHRGAIFGMGLLCAAAGYREAGRADEMTMPTLGAIVSARWGREIAAEPVSVDSHGGQVSRRYRVGGARAEAINGFPNVYRIALPALHAACRLSPNDAEAARVHACFALIATLADTNLLHRGGEAGLAFAQRAARDFLDDGSVAQSDWRTRAQHVHEAFVERNLSPGGSADLLSMALFVQAADRRLHETVL